MALRLLRCSLLQPSLLVWPLKGVISATKKERVNYWVCGRETSFSHLGNHVSPVGIWRMWPVIHLQWNDVQCHATADFTSSSCLLIPRPTYLKRMPAYGPATSWEMSHCVQRLPVTSWYLVPEELCSSSFLTTKKNPVMTENNSG